MNNSTPRSGLPRWIEIPLAILGLLLTVPLWSAAALAVLLSSPGPILFRQQRIGRGGQPFTLRKFRSMRLAGDGLQITAKGDSRITAVGRLLRSSKLDELPELWNILVGEMSFVGPRPEVPGYVDLDDALWRQVLIARPGLTDPVTLRLRNEERLLSQVDGDRDAFYRSQLLPWKLRGYRDYLLRRSVGSDMVIILKTLVAVVLPASEPPPTLEEIRRSTGGSHEHRPSP